MTDPLIEAMARAIKDEIARQFDATPLPGPNPSNDWSAMGGTIELELAASAALQAHDNHLKEQGLVVVPREPTEEMVVAGKREGQRDTDDTPLVSVYQAMLTAYEQEK